MTLRHTLVVSDVHLSQTHPDDPSDPLWMRYRRRENHPDEEFAALIDHVLASLNEGEQLEVAFNGDVLDFDAPWVKDGTSSFEEFPLNDAGCGEHAARIAADHPTWFEAAAKVVLAGHRVVFLSGNHDIELYWPAARTALRGAIGEHAARLATLQNKSAPTQAELEARVRFRAWFHLTEDKIYLEHGSQYDVFNGVRYAMIPITRARDWIHPVMGKLAFKRIGSRMGYFNPYYEETFYMGLFGYLGHFWRFYARSHRHIMRTWAKGAVRTALEVLRHRHQEDWREENARLAHEETGVALEAIRATHALRVEPAETPMLPILREMWIDRVLGGLAVALAAGIAAIFGLKVGLITLGALVAVFVLYEILTPKPDIRTYDSAPDYVTKILDIHGAGAMCFGHTHRPFGRWDDGRFYGNSGSWCPAFRDAHCKEPVLDRRPLLLLTTRSNEDGSVEVGGGLHWWKAGKLEADSEHSRPRPTREGAATEAA